MSYARRADDGCSRQKEFSALYNITVGRLEQDPEAQGVIRPADDSWQLVIDKDGFPHLWVRVMLADNDQSGHKSGLMPVESVMDTSIRDLMTSEAGEPITDQAELDKASAEWQELQSKMRIPCPR